MPALVGQADAATVRHKGDEVLTEPVLVDNVAGIGPMHAHLYRSKRAKFVSITDEDAMTWGLNLSQMEGIIPAIETAHAFSILDIMKFTPDDILIFNCSGRGDKDLDTYINYFKL